MPITDITFDPPVPLSSLFPPSVAVPPATRDEANAAPPTPPSLLPTNGTKEPVVSALRVLDYRYYRLLLHPETGLWRMARDWRDPTWASASFKGLRKGPTSKQRAQRKTLFGDNIISIEAKTIPQLLLDECLHPFCKCQRQAYRIQTPHQGFQIASRSHP